MNNLGDSSADYKKYEELGDLRRENMKLALPYFEKAYEFDETNTNILQTLKNIYSQLSMTDKYKAVKEKLEALEAN